MNVVKKEDCLGIFPQMQIFSTFLLLVVLGIGVPWVVHMLNRSIFNPMDRIQGGIHKIEGGSLDVQITNTESSREMEHLIPEDDSVRLLSQFVDRMFLGGLYRTYRREGHANEPTPHQMLKILVYAYMNGIYSSRDIESACRRDINFMWLLEGAKVPDHTTIARFRTLHFGACGEKVMTEVSLMLYRLGELSGETIFIDGTKIEACANKYTFVWKKSVTKNLEKLLGKLAAFLESCEELYGIRVVCHNQVKMKHVKKLRKGSNSSMVPGNEKASSKRALRHWKDIWKN